MHFVSIRSWPFLLHILIETPAAITFALRPSATLPTPQPHAHALIRQYALLLLSSNAVAAMFALQIHDAELSSCIDWQTERWVAGSLALYHVGPFLRAWHRDYNKEGRGRSIFGRPKVHAISHLLCVMALTGRCLEIFG